MGLERAGGRREGGVLVTPDPAVHITIYVQDTASKVDLTLLVVRLSQFQFQIIFFNILNFSEFSGIFLDYYGKSPISVCTDTGNRLYDF